MVCMLSPSSGWPELANNHARRPDSRRQLIHPLPVLAAGAVSRAPEPLAISGSSIDATCSGRGEL
jgi:hypothetical protein